MSWLLLGGRFCIEFGAGTLVALAFVAPAPVGPPFYRLMGALAAVPLIVDRGRRGLAALLGVEAADLPAQVARIDTPGLSEIACLMETPVVADVRARHAGLRIVPGAEVWPPAALGRRLSSACSRSAASA